MSEWFDAYETPPPMDGQWIIAVCNDFSCLEFLQFFEGEWINGSGEGNLFEDEYFGIHYSVWTYAPKWMRIYAVQEARDAKDGEWRKANNLG